MSVFRVKLAAGDQGNMDVDPITGKPVATSIQRTAYVMGPNRINRQLIDGETFSDCNYWKRFAYPQVSWEEAMIEVVTDDGSTYSDVAEENTFVVGEAFPAVQLTYDDANTLDFVTDHGGPASFLQITNTDGAANLTIELNANTLAVMTIAPGDVHVFNSGDLSISQIRLLSDVAGSTAEVLASVKSVCNS
jgi:hypothetical protein